MDDATLVALEIDIIINGPSHQRWTLGMSGEAEGPEHVTVV